MANFFGIEVDTANMTLEELEEAKRKTRNMLAHLEHQILLRKMAERKYSSDSTTR